METPIFHPVLQIPIFMDRFGIYPRTRIGGGDILVEVNCNDSYAQVISRLSAPMLVARFFLQPHPSLIRRLHELGYQPDLRYLYYNIFGYNQAALEAPIF